MTVGVYDGAWRALSVFVGRPIFILSAPRSGSTFLFECLARSGGVVHLDREADEIWWRTFPYGPETGFCDFVGADQASRYAIRRVAVGLYGAALWQGRRKLRWRSDARRFPLRYLDKTIANCFHLGFLERAFPDARYVFLVRDPRAVVSSMLEGWAQPGRFTKPRLQPVIRRVTNATVDHWCYPAPPRWTDVLHQALPSICAWSWKQHMEHVLEHFRDRWQDVLTVRYEDLVANTPAVVNQLASRLELPVTSDTMSYARSPALSWSTVSPPRMDKWRDLHGDEVDSVLPIIRELAARLGYTV